MLSLKFGVILLCAVESLAYNILAGTRTTCTAVNGIAGACDLRLHQFTLAGTHNSGAGAEGLLYDYYTGLNTISSCHYRNQYKNLTQQLESGIRYFDFDVSYTPEDGKNVIRIAHGEWWTVKGYCGTVTHLLHGIIDFMDKNRDAVVMVRMKDVLEPETVKELLGPELDELVRKNGNKVRFSPRDTQNPLLKDAIEKNERLFLYVNDSIYDKKQTIVHRLQQVETYEASTSFATHCEMDDAQFEYLQRDGRVTDNRKFLQIDWYIGGATCVDTKAEWCTDQLHRLGEKRKDGEKGLNTKIVEKFNRPINAIIVDDDAKLGLKKIRDVVEDINYNNVKSFRRCTDRNLKSEDECYDIGGAKCSKSDWNSDRDTCLGCNCKFFTNDNGYGDCKLEWQGGLMCLVIDPTGCSDAKPSTSIKGEWWSKEACSPKKP